MQTRFSSRTLYSYARLVPQWTAACPSPFQWLCSRETRCRPAVRSHAALYQSLPAPCTAMYLHNTTFSCASALKISKPVHHIVYIRIHGETFDDCIAVLQGFDSYMCVHVATCKRLCSGIHASQARRRAEVWNLEHATVGVHQHVVAFDIPMNDLVVMLQLAANA